MRGVACVWVLPYACELGVRSMSELPPYDGVLGTATPTPLIYVGHTAPVNGVFALSLGPHEITYLA